MTNSLNINFREELAALTGDTFTRRCELAGLIKTITVHFPSGCNSLCDVNVFKGSQQLLPEKDYIALDDATPTFTVNEPINKGDTIIVNINNHDNTESHTLSVIVTIEGTAKTQ